MKQKIRIIRFLFCLPFLLLGVGIFAIGMVILGDGHMSFAEWCQKFIIGNDLPYLAREDDETV